VDFQEPGEEAGDPVTAAFEALRQEVESARADLDKVLAEVRAANVLQGREAPDYALTFGEILKQITSVGAAVGKLDHHPALRLTPQAFAAQVEEAGRIGEARGHEALQACAGRMDRAVAQLDGLIGRRREAAEQRSWVIAAGVMGGAVGVLLAMTAIPWVVRHSPQSWKWDEGFALAYLHGDSPWAAGMRLMQDADSKSWNVVARGDQLELDNAQVLGACERQAQSVGKEVRCTVKVAPAGQKAGQP
jgi:hypothetical protein